MKKVLPLMLCLAAAGSLPAAAYGHGVTKPQHGGVVQMNGETLFELVAAPAGVSLYVIEEDEPVSAATMTANLAVTTGGKKTSVAMAPLKGNQFFAKGLKLPKGANVGVQVIDKTTKARYGATFLIK